MLWIAFFVAFFLLTTLTIFVVQKSRKGAAEPADAEAVRRKRAFRAVMEDPALRAPSYR